MELKHAICSDNILSMLKQVVQSLLKENLCGSTYICAKLMNVKINIYTCIPCKAFTLTVSITITHKLHALHNRALTHSSPECIL